MREKRFFTWDFILATGPTAGLALAVAQILWIEGIALEDLSFTPEQTTIGFGVSVWSGIFLTRWLNDPNAR